MDFAGLETVSFVRSMNMPYMPPDITQLADLAAEHEQRGQPHRVGATFRSLVQMKLGLHLPLRRKDKGER